MSPEEFIEQFKQMSPEEQQQWMKNAIAKSTHYFEQYVDKECHTDEERNFLTSDVTSLWKRLNSYMKPNRQRAYGLAVGRVQSGKTRNYIGLMFKAIDNGYNTIIILTSKNSRLAVQTHERVERWFGDQNGGLGISNYCFLTRKRESAVGVEWLGGKFASNRINVGIVLKNESGHLANIRKWLEGMGHDSRAHMRLLFIDDESDSATPNTRNIGDPLIDSDAEVAYYADLVRTKYRLFEEPDKGQKIADWMKNLLQREFDGGLVDTLRNNAESMTKFMDLVRTNDEFKSATGLAADVQVGEQNSVLSELVYHCFNNRQTKRQPLNWTVLRDLFFYVLDIKQERSRINRSICEIVGLDEANQQQPTFNYEKMIYVGYTATPFANMLNENPTQDPLCPDCIQPLTMSSQYFGLHRIFGGRSGETCNMDIVRPIEDDEYKAWVEPIQMPDEDNGQPGVEVNCSDELIREYNVAEEGQPANAQQVEWRSLKKAIQWAFCTAAARRVRRLTMETDDSNDIKYRWTTMLFNLSQLSNQENGAHGVQQRLVQRYVNYVTQPANRDGFINACRELWQAETQRFTKERFGQACAGYGDIADYPTFDEIEGEIRTWFLGTFGKVKVIQVNSAVDNGPEMDYANPDAATDDALWIVCGGNAISRGLTLEGLTVSYFDRIRASSAVNAITQMGRWFGYRPGYELLPRIWMRESTIQEMKQICRIEESLHASLAELYGEDGSCPPSIRTGVDVASVRFFGRRLSGRDANGAVFSGVSSKGIFKDVNGNAALAMGATRQFINGLGDVYSVQQHSTKPLNTRHRLFWRDVPPERVSAYIGDLAQNYFSGVSIYEAQGLLHEIGNSHCSWNIVVGNPGTNQQFGADAGVFAGLGIRNNPFKKTGTDVQIGTGQLTSGAFLARMPDDLTVQALQSLNNPNVVPGDMRHVEKTYELANKTTDIDRALLNPILLIDFTHGDGESPYVQVSFYWYGRSAESYFRAVVNPRPPSDLFNRAIGIVQERRYISFHALCRILNVEEKDPNRDQLRDELRAESQNLTSAIGEVSAEEARNALIQTGVFYSREWERDVSWPMAIGLKIGSDLYRRIFTNNWNDYGASHLPNLSTLRQNFLDCIIMFAEADFSGLWRNFAGLYAPTDQTREMGDRKPTKRAIRDADS